MLEKTKTSLLVITSAILVLTVIGVTYAFFSTRVNNAQRQEADISTGTMRMIFADNDTGTTGSLNFGESITKKFTITNTGSLPVVAKINWKDLVNTYLSGSLTYTFEYSSNLAGPYTKQVIDKNGPASSEVLMNSLTIQPGITYYCNLIITLNNLDTVDQTVDLSATFKTGFSLEEGKIYTSDTTLASLGQTVKTAVPNFNQADPFLSHIQIMDLIQILIIIR